ncbi:MAG: NADH-quinone oxidoreductase subunit NuoK [Saprospiraceae bacterium]|nr:NADH-quinone oxidoreductase subunit NuoK [Saprospiraceae bacterium]HMW39381.1 NADH-quinone oxidoreductase subunit NuoK [Saprospiraceae bacterium]HMX89208.1 NADH-quinone oxidoreductase subunit NuoK [Saprospiraceae bacterium]HMZ41144.1 NADH-quinone oxidoreductase subunit NuoK [Saprospiraceae bacterium]HNA64362.1 NADH-quinone oxidoreductase subunit NuoK [Saprospiraceae bacterium]
METAAPQIFSSIPLTHYIMLSAALFMIGLIGVMVRRNVIIVFMCIEIMLNAANLMLTAASSYYGNAAGQIMVFFTMAVAAAEVSVGLAIIVMIYKNLRTINLDVFNKLKG